MRQDSMLEGIKQGREASRNIRFCSSDGAPRPMFFADKSKRSRTRLTTGADDGKPTRSVNYREFERGFLRFMDQLDWTEVLAVADSEELTAAGDGVASIKLNIERANLTSSTALTEQGTAVAVGWMAHGPFRQHKTRASKGNGIASKNYVVWQLGPERGSQDFPRDE